MTDAELIREAVQKSGLSARAFAENITWRDERTIRRWMSGDQELPTNARKQLEWFVALPHLQLKALVDAASTSFRIDGAGMDQRVADLRLTDEDVNRRWGELLAALTEEFAKVGIEDFAAHVLHNPEQRFVSFPFRARNGEESFTTRQVDSETLLSGSLRRFARSFLIEFLRMRILDDIQCSPQLRERVQTKFPGADIQVEHDPDDDDVTPTYWLVPSNGQQVLIGTSHQEAEQWLEDLST